jgi:hypothetical protein
MAEEVREDLGEPRERLREQLVEDYLVQDLPTVSQYSEIQAIIGLQR